MSGLQLGIAAMGLATPIGTSREAVAATLFHGTRDGLATRDDILPGRALHIGTVDGPLPSLPGRYRSLDCRNNRLMLAALEQIADAVDAAADRYGRDRVAVILGTSTGGIAEGEAAYLTLRNSGAWPDSYHYQQQELSSLAFFAADFLGLGSAAYTVATACSSSAKVFASARRLIRAGLCDAAVVGGADTLCRMTVGGFSSLEAVSAGLCSPFSRNRDGINLGEASAAFLLTREAATVNLLGIGESSDAYHISAPEPEGRGAAAAMATALTDAAVPAQAVGYVNLHGTGTQLNDIMEGKAVHSLFGSGIPCSSTKGMTGHTLGAAGACEAAFLWLALHPDHNPQGLLPPHLWDGAADPEIPAIRLTQPGDRLGDPAGRAAMLSNSFAFGGSNIALVFGRGNW